jgi:hypothetical protein
VISGAVTKIQKEGQKNIMKTLVVSSFAVAVVATLGFAGTGSAKAAVDEALYSKVTSTTHAVIAGNASVSGKVYVDGSTVVLGNNTANTKTRLIDFSGGLGGKSDITENGNLWINTDDNLYLNAKDAGGQVIVSGAGKLTFASVTAGLNPTLELASSGKSAAGRRNWSGMWAADNTMYLTGHQAGGIVVQLNSEYNPAFTVDGTDALDGKGVVGATLRLGADQTDYTALTTWFVANQDLVAGDVVMAVTNSVVNGSRRVTKTTAAGDDFVGVVVRDASAGKSVEVAIAGIVKVKHAIAGEVRALQGEAVILSDATDGGVMDGETAANVVGIAMEDGTVGGKVTVLLSGPTQN